MVSVNQFCVLPEKNLALQYKSFNVKNWIKSFPGWKESNTQNERLHQLSRLYECKMTATTAAVQVFIRNNINFDVSPIKSVRLSYP